MSRTPNKKKETDKVTAVFIHSMHRTGSAYLWNKFRQNNRYYCYYDPFHQGMRSLDAGDPHLENLYIKNAKQLRHPVLDKEYTDEYMKLLVPDEKGVPFFKKSFTIDDYCNNNENPDQKKYIDFLIQSAGTHIPLFKSNLTPLRIQWFEDNYPDAFHIYLLRNPRNQFQSYFEMLHENLDVFLTMNLMIGGVNRESPLFKPLASHIPLLEYHAERFEDEYYIYSKIIPAYSNYEMYFIFYYIWFTALVENVLHSDMILNIDHIDHVRSYRTSVCDEITNRGIPTIDFDDAIPWEYKKYDVKKSEMGQVEKTVQSLVLRQYSNKNFELFESRIEPHNREYFELQKETLSFLRRRPIEPVDMSRSVMEKNDRLVENFSTHLLELRKTSNKPGQTTKEDADLLFMKQELTKKRKEAAEKTQQLLDRDKLLQQRDRLIADLELQAKQDMETYKQDLDKKDELIKLLHGRKEIVDLVLEVHDKDQLLEEKDRQLAQKEWELKDIELRTKQKLETYSTEQEQKDRIIEEIKQALSRLEPELAQKTHALEKIEKMAAWKDQQIAEKDQLLKKKDARLEALTRETSAQIIRIEEQNKRIDELTAEINWLNSQTIISKIRRIFSSSTTKKV